MIETTIIHRRHFLVGAAITASIGTNGINVATFAQSAKSLPGYAGWKVTDALVVHSNNTLETKRNAIGTSIVTPNSSLSVTISLHRTTRFWPTATLGKYPSRAWPIPAS